MTHDYILVSNYGSVYNSYAIIRYIIKPWPNDSLEKLICTCGWCANDMEQTMIEQKMYYKYRLFYNVGYTGIVNCVCEDKS